MVNHLFTQSFTEKSVELELCFLQFLLPPLLADWSQSEGEWLAKGWCATNIRITLCNIFVFHNVHHARWINPSVINCYCVLGRNVGTLHAQQPQKSSFVTLRKFGLVIGEVGQEIVSHELWEAGCPVTQAPLPSMELQQVAFCWHTLYSRPWDMAAQLTTLPSLRMACRPIVTKVQHNVLRFHSSLSFWRQHHSFSLPWLHAHVSFLASYWPISRIASLEMSY